MGYYDDIASGYEWLHREEQESKLAVILSNLPFALKPTLKLLDVGCGTGISLEPWLCKKKGIDPSAKLVSIAQAKGLDVVPGSSDKLPFKDLEFDIVTSITALHHVDDPEQVASEIARVCKSWLIVSYLRKADVHHRELVMRALSKHFVKEKVIEHDKDVIYFMKKKSL